MPVVHICPLSALKKTAVRVKPSHVVTLLDPSDWAETPAGIDPARHHRVGVHDYAERIEGMTVPEEGHVLGLIDFLKTWDARAPILIHCWAGISRSTATALIALCLHNPGREREAALALRFASDVASPNRRIVMLADDALGLSGRLVNAVTDMGRGREAFENVPFSVPLDLDRD